MKTAAYCGAAVLALGITACSSEPEPAKPAAVTATPAAAAVPDHTSIFPDAGKVATSVVPNHILDMKSTPGGSLAEYDDKGKKYRMFVIDVDTNQKAMFLMLDMKAEMEKDPEYLSYMGGYFGAYSGKPFYLFAKLHYIAGVEGLPKARADSMMRELAAQLH